MDVLAVERAARDAAQSVREGGGPHFLELRTYRFRAHSMYDPDRYRDKAEVEQWKERDPIPALAGLLQTSGVLTEEDLDRLEDAVTAEIDEAVAFAEAGTFEEVADLERFVTSEPTGPAGAVTRAAPLAPVAAVEQVVPSGRAEVAT
jgi:pyruvate dehydrogenase E1 component subunit alpha